MVAPDRTDQNLVVLREDTNAPVAGAEVGNGLHAFTLTTDRYGRVERVPAAWLKAEMLFVWVDGTCYSVKLQFSANREALPLRIPTPPCWWRVILGGLWPAIHALWVGGLALAISIVTQSIGDKLGWRWRQLISRSPPDKP